VLKSVASGGTVGDTTTLEDGAAVEEVKQAFEELRKEVKS
jgi:hypothetical protein